MKFTQTTQICAECNNREAECLCYLLPLLDDVSDSQDDAALAEILMVDSDTAILFPAQAMQPSIYVGERLCQVDTVELHKAADTVDRTRIGRLLGAFAVGAWLALIHLFALAWLAS